MAEQGPSDSQRQAEVTASGRLIRLDGSEAPPSETTRRRRAHKRMPGLAMLPTALTLGNAIAGIASLIELLKAYAAVTTGNTEEVYLRLGYAALLIGVGFGQCPEILDRGADWSEENANPEPVPLRPMADEVDDHQNLDHDPESPPIEECRH
jgi:hypothetical protein